MKNTLLECRFFDKWGNKLILAIFILVPMVALIRYPVNGDLIVDGGDGLTGIINWLYAPRELYRGSFPVWNKYLENGVPTVATGSGALICIPALLLGWLPIEWFVFFIYCLHISAGAYFMYLYLLEIKCNRKASFVVAAMFLFSIHLGGGRKSHIAIVFACTFFPVVLYFIQRHLNTERYKDIAFASGAIALAFSYTQIQHAVYIITASSVYFLACLLRNKVRFVDLIKRLSVLAGLIVAFSAVVLLPTAEVLLEYGKYKTTDPFFDWTTGGSINPIVLITMLFPRFWSNPWANSGFIRSSGFDIEFFIGSAVFIVVVYTIKRYLRNSFQILLSLGMSLTALAYMSLYYIPILRDIVFNIPVFNSFRYPSRMAFVFLFFLYAVIALGLTKIIETDSLSQYFRFHHRFTVAVSTICLVSILIMIAGADIVGGEMHGENIEAILNFGKNSLMPVCFILLGLSAIFLVIGRVIGKNNSNDSQKKAFSATIAFICVVTIFQTIPFWLFTNATPNTHSIEDESSTAISASINNGKGLEIQTDSSSSTIFNFHKGLLRHIPTFNAYIPFNNPKLYMALTGADETPFSATGLFTGLPDAKHNLFIRNDLLSMMGIRIINDPTGYIPDEGSSMFDYNTRKPIIENCVFELAPSDMETQIYSEIAEIKPYTYYLVSMNYSVDPNEEGFARMDFASGVYNVWFPEIPIENGEYEALVYSGDTELAEGMLSEGIYFRVISAGLDKPLEVSSLNLYEITATDTITYTPLIVNEQYRIFENVNARDILYFSDQVRELRDADYIYKRSGTYQNLDRISYIVGADNRIFNIQSNTISDINFENNYITGIVSSEDGGFLNFSQSYFPGWRVYIDGKRTDLEQVNGLIMGAYVPAGTYEVKFSFVSVSFILGLVISFLSITMCIVVFGVIPRIRKVRVAQR